MEKPVCVILGAGASADAWNSGGPSRSGNWNPPVAAELFNFGRREVFLGPASPYHGVQVLAADLGELGGQSLEAKLQEYARDPRDLIKRYFRQVPLYLRDLLVEVTTKFTSNGANPGNHVRLCLRLLKDHQVAFLDLNYDDYLERALPVCDESLGINNLLDYVKPGRRAIVGKVHGSIHWGTPIALPPQSEDAENLLRVYCDFDPLSPCTELIFQPSRKNTFNWRDLESRKLLYPVLTAPLAGKDHTALVCPKGHLETLGAFLRGCKHFLVIGTSGLDDDLLGFLGQHVSSVDVVQYVNLNAGTQECRGRFEKAVHPFHGTQKKVEYASGFTGYLGSPEFQDVLRA
jgi:hypothetical protein